MGVTEKRGALDVPRFMEDGQRFIALAGLGNFEGLPGQPANPLAAFGVGEHHREVGAGIPEARVAPLTFSGNGQPLLRGRHRRVHDSLLGHPFGGETCQERRQDPWVHNGTSWFGELSSLGAAFTYCSGAASNRSRHRREQNI